MPPRMFKLKRFLEKITGREGDILDRDLRNILKDIPLESKRDLIVKFGNEVAKQRALSKVPEAEKERGPKDYADDVMAWAHSQPEPAVVAPLREALDKAGDDWIAEFRDSEGVASLCGVMEDLADGRDQYLAEGDDDNPKIVPPKEVELEEEIVRCLMVLLNKNTGLSALEGSANLWPVLARSAIDSTSDTVRCSLLKVLTVMVEIGTNGLKVVLNALDAVKLYKESDLQFSCLVETLRQARDETGLAPAVGVAVFLNTILSKAVEFQDRVVLRGGMLEAGMLEAVTGARSRFICSQHMFEDSDSDGDADHVAVPLSASGSKARRLLEGMSDDDDDGDVEEDYGSFAGSKCSSRTSVISATSSTVSRSGGGGDVGRFEQLRSELHTQLDLFERVMQEDQNEMDVTFGAGGGGENNPDAPHPNPLLDDARDREPAALQAMRDAIATVDGDEEVSVELELIVEKLEIMGTAGCGLDLWRTVRDAVSTAAIQGGTRTPTPAGPSSCSIPPAPLSLPVAPLAPGAAPPPLPPPLPPRSLAATIATLPAAAGPVPMAPPLPPGALSLPVAPPLPGVVAGGLPPPPPLPGMKGPPAPPPLPGMKGLPPPPPLPGMKGLPLPGLPGVKGPPVVVKPKGPKRRGVHWTKIKTGIKGTVFEEIVKDVMKVEVPKDLLLAGFEEEPKAPKRSSVRAGGEGAGEGGGADGEAKEEEDGNTCKKKKAVSLLGGKALNYGIVFSTLSVGPEKVGEAVMSMDMAVLDADTLEKLRKLEPQPAELVTLKAYKGELSELVEVERFMVLASRIPNYDSRLRCAHIMQSFQGNVDFTSARLQVVDDAVNEVVNSAKLKRLLAVVLAIGNFLNEDGHNGNADAITLESLLKLPTVRRTKKRDIAGVGDDNLLHALLEWADKEEKSLLTLSEDLPTASRASRLCLDDLKKEVLCCSKDLRIVEAKVEEAKKNAAAAAVAATTTTNSNQRPNSIANEKEKATASAAPAAVDRFVDKVEPFLAAAKGTMENLRNKQASVEESYKKAAIRFGKDPKTCPNEDFFDLMKAVVLMVEGTARDNKERAENEASRIRREKRAAERLAKKAKTAAAAAAGEAGGGGGDGRVDLTSLLKSGANRMRERVTGGGTVNDEYKRIKKERGKENDAFKEISETQDVDKREHLRDRLKYQRSDAFHTQQRSMESFAGFPSGNNRSSGDSSIMRGVSSTISRHAPPRLNTAVFSSAGSNAGGGGSGSGSGSRRGSGYSSNKKMLDRQTSGIQQASMLREKSAMRKAEIARMTRVSNPGAAGLNAGSKTGNDGAGIASHGVRSERKHSPFDVRGGGGGAALGFVGAGETSAARLDGSSRSISSISSNGLDTSYSDRRYHQQQRSLTAFAKNPSDHRLAKSSGIRSGNNSTTASGIAGGVASRGRTSSGDGHHRAGSAVVDGRGSSSSNADQGRMNITTGYNVATSGGGGNDIGTSGEPALPKRELGSRSSRLDGQSGVGTRSTTFRMRGRVDGGVADFGGGSHDHDGSSAPRTELRVRSSRRLDSKNGGTFQGRRGPSHG